MLEAVKKLSNGLKLLRPIGNDYCNDNLQEIHTHSHGSNELSITIGSRGAFVAIANARGNL